MRHEEDAAARVRRKLSHWVSTEGHGSRKRLADAVHGLYGKARSASWVTDLLDGPEHGGQDLRLRDLDAVAAIMKVPPGELVAKEGHEYIEVTASELRLLRFYRALPDVARHHFLALLDFLRGQQEIVADVHTRERDVRTAEARRDHARLERTRKKGA